MEETVQTHASFGMIEWSRVQGRSSDLFGSSLEHNNIIRLSISHAQMHRTLNRDWPFSGKPIIEIEMAPNQFTDFLTTPNTTGVPCTIRYMESIGSIVGMPIASKRKVFEEEFEQDLKNIGKNFNTLEEFVNSLSKKTNLTKTDKEQLSNLIFQVRRIIDDHIPFAQKSFNEQLDNSVTEAKAAIEAFTETKVRSLGLEALKNSTAVKLLENTSSPAAVKFGADCLNKFENDEDGNINER